MGIGDRGSFGARPGEGGAAGTDRYGAESRDASGVDAEVHTPDAEAVARNAIEEVKREAGEAKRSLESAVIGPSWRASASPTSATARPRLVMKKKAADYRAKRAPIKLILALAVVVMIGVAALIGTQDLSRLDPGASGAASQAPEVVPLANPHLGAGPFFCTGRPAFSCTAARGPARLRR